LNAWHHIALTRASNTFKLFVDGTQVGTATSTATMTRSYSDLFIGSSGHTWNATRATRGFIDGFRITRGTARYTSAFTAPSSAHLTSAGDVNKHIVVNSDADGVAVGTGGISQARIAKAWVNFEGTDTSNIRGSYNVSSISDRGTGLFTVNFSTAMTDANYAVNATSGHGSDTATTATARTGGTISTTACHISTGYRSSSSVLADMNYNAVTFFGN
jgi:hypothetical protein